MENLPTFAFSNDDEGERGRESEQAFRFDIVVVVIVHITLL